MNHSFARFCYVGFIDRSQSSSSLKLNIPCTIVHCFVFTYLCFHILSNKCKGLSEVLFVPRFKTQKIKTFVERNGFIFVNCWQNMGLGDVEPSTLP